MHDCSRFFAGTELMWINLKVSPHVGTGWKGGGGGGGGGGGVIFPHKKISTCKCFSFPCSDNALWAVLAQVVISDHTLVMWSIQ